MYIKHPVRDKKVTNPKAVLQEVKKEWTYAKKILHKSKDAPGKAKDL